MSDERWEKAQFELHYAARKELEALKERVAALEQQAGDGNPEDGFKAKGVPCSFCRRDEIRLGVSPAGQLCCPDCAAVKALDLIFHGQISCDAITRTDPATNPYLCEPESVAGRVRDAVASPSMKFKAFDIATQGATFLLESLDRERDEFKHLAREKLNRVYVALLSAWEEKNG